MIRNTARRAVLVRSLVALFLSLGAAGCGGPSRDEILGMLGIVTFTLLIVLLLADSLVPWIHGRSWFPRLAGMLKPWASVAAAACAVGGLAAIVAGLAAYTNSGSEPKAVMSLAGITLFGAGGSLWAWKSETDERRRIKHMRRFFRCIPFSLILFMIATGRVALI